MSKLTSQLAKGSALALSMMLLGRVSTLLLQVMLSRYLGASAYGVMVLLTSLARLGQRFIDLGINQGIVRFGATYAAANDVAALRRIVKCSALLVAAGSAVWGFLLWYFRDRLVLLLGGDTRLEDLIGITLLLLIMLSVLAWASGVIKSQKQVGRASFVREAATPLARFIIIGAIILVGGQLTEIMWGFVAGTAFALFVGMFYVFNIIANTSNWGLPSYKAGQQLQPKAGTLLRVSLPMFLSGFSYAVILYVDRFMIGYYLNEPAHVGVYHAAATIAMQMNVVFMACNAMFAPMITEAHQKDDKEAFATLFYRIPWWAFLLTAPLILAVAFNAKLIMSIFGAEFVAGATVLVILLAAQAYNVFTGPVGVVLQMTGRQNIDMYINLALVVINIIMNVLLIPMYGVEGAAVATLISVVGVHSCRLVVVKIIFGIHPFSARLVLLGSTTTIGLLFAYFYADGWSLLMGFAISIGMLIVFALWLWKFGLDKDDRDILSRAKMKIYSLVSGRVNNTDKISGGSGVNS